MKHRFLAKKYWKDASTPFGTTNEKAARFDDCINLSLGDPDLITDKIIIDGAYQDALKGHTRYTNMYGDIELRNEIRKFYKDEYDLDIAPDEVIVTTSGLIAMYMALQAVLDEGDEVIIQSPFFTPYTAQVEMARGIPVELDTYEEEDFQINIERLKSLITPRTKALIINTPSNPTGSCLSAETLNEIARIAEEEDLIVIADDIYTSYSFEKDFIPFMSVPGMRERTITINSFSKNFIMTGWRVGNIIAPNFIVRVLKDMGENIVYSAPALSQRAALHALRNRNVIQPPIIAEYRKRMEYAAERINRIPWMSVITPPKGSFYLFINIKKSGLSSMDAADMILEKAHVLLLPGNAFGHCGEGYLRLACTVGVDKLEEAFDRIEKIEL
ncbi:MAG TPA: pyridoxal phosphate-dependent aminotransferase [Candidatus Fimisoma avicola]|uniref:Pyridoxal phosphate-dependent aminotransferase n=1 Tax=Candidatus Fimisoma avicola TaxID=2840826 RepID=A0A9D1I6R3_9FIRM|nr:pyridoxal phosphate-dependent aminotransferase [Candidatus Fimisoma avicola]